MTPTPNVVPVGDTRVFTATQAVTETAVAVSTISNPPGQQQTVSSVTATGGSSNGVDDDDGFGEYLCRGMAPPQLPPPSDIGCKADIIQLGLKVDHVNLFCEAYKRHCAVRAYPISNSLLCFILFLNLI